MVADYHVHTSYCGHARGEIHEYIERAVSIGLDEIGFTDHLGRYYLSKSQRKKHWDWGIKDHDLPEYFDTLSKMKEKYKDQITVKIGLEIDYIKGAEETASEIMTRFPLDYTICSIHSLPGIGPKHLYQYKDRDPLPIYTEYFSAANDALKCGIFRVLAHLDFIWRYIPWPVEYSQQIYQNIKKTVETAANSPTLMEINVNGFIGEFQNKISNIRPFSFMTEEIARRNTGITIGSDAHEPKAVGYMFSEMFEYLTKQGIKTFCTFDDRDVLIHKIPL
ncbi:Histidinol-phosphatase [Chitinispirillum alkaliphilum]|nr:Histidinol-phosphatase [Chitinispirillum alkaliphilum]